MFSCIAVLINMAFLHTIIARKEQHIIWLTFGKETRKLLSFLFKNRVVT